MAPRRSIGVDNEVTVGRRDFSPAHFLFKIESFSLLSENGIDKYESSEFESGDYKWKLIIYPNGRNTEDGGNHVSAYLAVADINSLPTGWEFNASSASFCFIVESLVPLVVLNLVRRRKTKAQHAPKQAHEEENVGKTGNKMSCGLTLTLILSGTRLAILEDES